MKRGNDPQEEKIMNTDLTTVNPLTDVRIEEFAGVKFRIEPTSYYGERAFLIRDLGTYGLTGTVWAENFTTSLPGVQITGQLDWLNFQTAVSALIALLSVEQTRLNGAKIMETLKTK